MGTHTYAVLPVPKEFYDFVENFLKEAGYEHAFLENGCIDMHGIALKAEQACRECGCTDLDCSQCIERTGKRCHWVETDLCSACVENQKS